MSLALTLFGFDDSSETFLVYDSYLDGEPECPLPAAMRRVLTRKPFATGEARSISPLSDEGTCTCP